MCVPYLMTEATIYTLVISCKIYKRVVDLLYQKQYYAPITSI